MPKSTFIPAGDHDFLVWMEHFIANLTPARGATESELATLKATGTDFHDITIHTNDTSALASRYYYRLQDRHPDRQIASFAVLTNQRGGKTIGHYQQSLWHTTCDFKFPVIKLQDWNNNLEQLEQHANPFALVVLAQLIAHRTIHDNLARKASKFQLIRLLYLRGYEKQEVLELFRFIDWILQLPKELELQLVYEIEQLEEQTMPYITSIERYATEKGIQIGEARGVALGEALGEAQTLLKLFKLKFGSVPEWVEQKVNSADKVQLDVWVEGILPAQSIECLFSGQNQTVDNLQKTSEQ